MYDKTYRRAGVLLQKEAKVRLRLVRGQIDISIHRSITRIIVD